jgi:hypothetical protein
MREIPFGGELKKAEKWDWQSFFMKQLPKWAHSLYLNDLYLREYILNEERAASSALSPIGGQRCACPCKGSALEGACQKGKKKGAQWSERRIFSRFHSVHAAR